MSARSLEPKANSTFELIEFKKKVLLFYNYLSNNQTKFLLS